MQERLDKIISSQSGLSRSEAKKLIKSGSVRIDNETVRNPDLKTDPSGKTFTVDGVVYLYEKSVYFMLNKPKGYVCSTDDPLSPTVLTLVPQEYRHRNLFPAGRLDKNTTGFVLITDDGEFAHDILSPKKHVKKTYIVTLERNVTAEEAEIICRGMLIDGEPLLPAELTKIDDKIYKIVISEGKYHQIKRMFGSFSNEVTGLKRIQIGSLPLDDNLEEGKCRKLTDEDIAKIKE